MQPKSNAPSGFTIIAQNVKHPNQAVEGTLLKHVSGRTTIRHCLGTFHGVDRRFAASFEKAPRQPTRRK